MMNELLAIRKNKWKIPCQITINKTLWYWSFHFRKFSLSQGAWTSHYQVRFCPLSGPEYFSNVDTVNFWNYMLNIKSCWKRRTIISYWKFLPRLLYHATLSKLAWLRRLHYFKDGKMAKSLTFPLSSKCKGLAASGSLHQLLQHIVWTHLMVSLSKGTFFNLAAFSWPKIISAISTAPGSTRFSIITCTFHGDS